VRCYASAVLAIVVCPSIHLSITQWYCITKAKHSITQATALHSPGTLVFQCQRSRWNSNGITHWGCQMHGVD